MSSAGERDAPERSGDPSALPSPPGVEEPPAADSALDRLLGGGPEHLSPLPGEAEPVADMSQPAAGTGHLLDDATIPALGKRRSVVTRPRLGPGAAPPRGPGDVAGAGEGFEVEQTMEWSLDQASQSVAGAGEDSHVIGGRYRIIEGLAMGGMGAVFKVKHLRLGKEFALKIIHSSLSEDENMQRFFFREARILSQLDHPNIVDVTDFGTDDRFGAFLVMEYLKGESLHSRLEREDRLAVGQAIAVGMQVAEALHSMHSDDLVHCDIKPENVFLIRTPEGRRKRVLAKLIDFGLSRNMAMGAELDSSEVGGTPIYAAPEQIRGLAPQASMDIYAVGELLYHMLTGQPPFVGTIPEICGAKLSRLPAEPSSLIPEELDPQLEALIMRSLATRPEERQSSMERLVYELRAVSDMLGLGTDSHSVKRSRPDPASPVSLSDWWGDCTLPVFVVDPGARVTHASAAFERLAGTSEQPAKGQPLGTTKIGNIYPQVDADVINTVAQKTPLQRTIRFLTAHDKEAALVIWLVPCMDGKGRVTHLWGVVVPG